MSVRIGSNIASLGAQRRVSIASDALGEVTERLSSGQRINRASDDAAGLAISSSLKTDSRIFSQAIRNLNDGISTLNIAEGGLSELFGIIQRITELSQQAANGTFSLSQRRAIAVEADTLVTEYNRMLQVSSVNGIKLLDGSLQSLILQGGIGSSSTISIGVGGELARAVGNGTFRNRLSFSAGDGPSSAATGDLNNDGKMDAIIGSEIDGRITVLLGNGDGTFLAPVSYAAVGDVDQIHLVDLNNDGRLDIVGAGNGGTGPYVLMGNGNGSFLARTIYGGGGDTTSIAVGDFNRDGRQDLILGDRSNSDVKLYLGNGDGSFRAVITYVGGANNQEIFTGDLNGDGTFRSRGTAFADFNNDGVLDILTVSDGDDTAGVFISNTSESTTLEYFNLRTANGAFSALSLGGISHSIGTGAWSYRSLSS